VRIGPRSTTGAQAGGGVAVFLFAGSCGKAGHKSGKVRVRRRRRSITVGSWRVARAGGNHCQLTIETFGCSPCRTRSSEDAAFRSFTGKERNAASSFRDSGMLLELVDHHVVDGGPCLARFQKHSSIKQSQCHLSNDKAAPR
jgi:hypothetical protein